MNADAYDLAALFGYRRALLAADPISRPSIRLLEPATGCGAIALLPGSFNPPTSAHLLLAERARREGFDCVAFVVGRVTAGKDPSGLIPEDRLAALRMIASPPEVSVAVASCGLYAEQAEAAARAFPGASVTFLVGSDKVTQIFDPLWYEDRDAALERLFARAALLVSPRADDGERVREILSAPENRRFADRIDVLPLHPAVSDLSSRRVRGLLQSGADPSGLVPPAVAAFLAEVRAFAPPVLVGREEIDAYRLRARLLDALWAARDWAESAADLEALTRLAADAGPDGARLRRVLAEEPLVAAELARLQAAASD